MASFSFEKNHKEPPHTEKHSVEKQKLVIVEHKHTAETQARDTAEERMTAQEQELKGFNGFVKRIWKHNLFHEYYRQKEIAKAKIQIIEKKDIFAGGDEDRTAHTDAMRALVDRFSSEYEETVHTHAGEERRTLSQTGKESYYGGELKRMIEQYAIRLRDAEKESEEKDRAKAIQLLHTAFQEDRGRILNRLTGMSREDIQSEVSHADNLFEVVRQIASKLSTQEGLANLDTDFEIIIGKAKSGVRTEAQFNTVDRLVKKLQSTPIGTWMNETTLASAVAIAYSLTGGISETIARSKAAAWGTFGLSAIIGAGVAGARKSAQSEEERRQHARELAKNKKFKPGSKRREEFESMRYSATNAQEITKTLGVFWFKEHLNAKEFADALYALADTEARIRVSDKQNIDLISYSDETTIERERLNLDIMRAKTKLALEKLVEQKKIIPPKGIVNFQDYLERATRAQEFRLLSETTEKNRLFSKMKARNVATAMVQGLATGLTVGTIVQEGISLLRPDQQGLVEGVWGGKSSPDQTHSLTALESLRRMFGFGGKENIVESTAPFVTRTISGVGTVKMPEGFNLVAQNGQGKGFNLVQGNQVIAKGIQFKDGHITENSLATLKRNGIFGSSYDRITSHLEHIKKPVEQFVRDHAPLFHHIKRFWSGSNTPLILGNETRFDGVRIDGDNYVLSIGRMTGISSYNSHGLMNVYFSLSNSTQHHAISVPIESDGSIRINSQSELGKLLFEKTQKGVKLLFRFAEAAHDTTSADTNPREIDVLATIVGSGQSNIEDTVRTHQKTPVTLLNPLLNSTKDTQGFPPTVMPLANRKSLEPVAQAKKKTPTAKPQSSIQEEKTTLRQRPVLPQEKKSQHKKESRPTSEQFKNLEEYFKKQPERKIEALKKLAAQAGVLENQRLSVCIPVSGNQAGTTLYKSLEQYANQTADKNAYELVLFVNPIETRKDGSHVIPEHTRKEITRFQKNHPGVPLRIISAPLRGGADAATHTIERLLQDVIWYRQYIRGKEAPEHIIIKGSAIPAKTEFQPGYLQDFLSLSPEAIRAMKAKREAKTASLKEKPESSPFNAEKIIRKYLNYQDSASALSESGQAALMVQATSKHMEKNAKLFYDLCKTYSFDALEKKAKDAITLSTKILKNNLGLTPSPLTLSTSWVYLAMADEYYYIQHPEKAGKDYMIANPMNNPDKFNEIINRKLGWEAYQNYHSGNNQGFLDRIADNTLRTSIESHLTKKPDAQDLAVLGALLRKIK